MKRSVFLLCALGLVCFGAVGCSESDSAPGLSDASTSDSSEPSPEGSVDSSSEGATSEDALADSPETGPSGLELYEKGYCEPFAQWTCDAFFACNCPVPAGIDFGPQPCLDRVKAECMAQMEPFKARVERGELKVHGDRIVQCLEKLRLTTGTCERPQQAPVASACEGAIASDEPIGQPCTFNYCAAGVGQCDGSSGSPVCRERPSLGQSCHGACQGEAVCILGSCQQPIGKDGACSQDEQCQAPLRCLGEKCTPLGTLDSSCTGQEQCTVGLRCENQKCAPPPSVCARGDNCGNQSQCVIPDDRRCGAPLGQGESCEQSSECGPTLYCDEGTKHCEIRPGLDQPCGNRAYCAEGLGCDDGLQVCRPAPSEGEPCLINDKGPFVCQQNLGCINGLCGPIPGLGQPCTMDNKCQSGYGCDFGQSGNTCITLVEEGQSCTTDFVCNPGLYCDTNQGKCRAAFEVGQACQVGNECGQGKTCVPDQNGQYHCELLPGEGQACRWDCESGLVCISSPQPGRCMAQGCSAVFQ